MVDAVVSYVLKKVGDYLIQEAVFLKEVRNEVESLKNELEWMQCFIKDAEEKQIDDAVIRKWVSDMRDIAYDTEDVLDKFIIKIHGENSSNLLKFDEKEEEKEVGSDSTKTLQVNAGETSNTANPFPVNEGRTSKNRSGFFASIKICSCIFNKNSSNQLEPGRHKLESNDKESVHKESGHQKLVLNDKDSVHKESSHTQSSLYNKGKEKVNLYSIGKEIEALRKRISDLSKKRDLYRLEGVGNKQEGKSNAFNILKELRRAPSFVVEENVVGFEDDAEKLLAKLLDEKEPRRFVISIFGMGGLGKTTLAKKLYHSNEVRNKFDCCAWVSVSQDYRTQDLLRRIIESFKIVNTMEEIEKLSEENLERFLHKSLEGHSYLVVIDDVWQKEAWESLRRAFPDNKNGSRVIITTRIREVAERSDDKTHAHELRFLRSDESWQLFCDKAFRNLNLDEGLEKLGREMVEKCGGLPLAIIVLGGLLSAKNPQEWRVVHDHIWHHLRSESIHISYLLALSFNDLSYQLKLCFLYLGLFPEDFEINVEELIRLLVAEGFILQDEDQVTEDVAKSNLDQLIDRSLIQTEQRYRGRIITCRVHDLLRDLAIQKAKELNFIHIYDEITHSNRSSIVSSCRRQAVYFDSGKCSWLQHCNTISRSLLLFKPEYDLLKKLVTTICTSFRLLRVLHVEGYRGSSPCQSVPKEIGQLIHLKHLGLRNVGIYNLPASLFHLRNLQTLDLYSAKWDLGLSSEVQNLQELRHLIGNFIGPLRIDNLVNLQTLKYVKYECWIKINPEKLVNLRELHIDCYMTVQQKMFVFDSIAKLKSIQILCVKLIGGYSFDSLQPLVHCPCLQDLRLDGKIEKLPGDMHELLPNLAYLSLNNSYLNDDPMPILEKLPSLMVLELFSNVYSGNKMTCTAKGFPRLESLELLVELEEWEVEEGAMPMLRRLMMPEVSNSKLRIVERLRSILVLG
ncbi:putative disease resistance RPP13-like protein 3 [Pistacia vera]|uniref:putative disease resistance RPP13-like protein 3 n=1 Tax=Pistacia vera TaxID=55513 RepID=UPI001263E266|nr:putative disease resistance RPP13-like protein 3 [Pistacia vera]